MQDDMILDMDTFDFNDILNSDFEEKGNVPTELNFEDINDYAEDEEDHGLDELEEEVEEEGNSFSNLSSFAESFDDIPDDIEFKVNGVAMSKADIAAAITKREEVDNSYTELEKYVANLNANEAFVQDKLNLSMSETETKLRHYNNLLSRPDKMSAHELREVYMHKSELEKRYATLEQDIVAVRNAHNARRDEVNVQRVKSTNVAMRGTEGWKGLETIRELASFAKDNGISPDVVMEGMSPGMMKMLLDAKKYQETISGSKKRVKDVVRGSNAPRSVSSKSKAKSPSAGLNQKARAAKLYAQGKLSNADMFKFLD